MYQNHYGQQTRRTQPPKVLTTKDCAYLTDALSWELLAAKKAHSFASQCSDQQVKNMLEQIGMLHQRHYDVLLNQLSTSEHDHSHGQYHYNHQEYQQ